MPEAERSMTARLLAVLEALSQGNRDGLTVAELSRVLGRDKSIVSRQLRSMAELGLVERSEDGRHRLGWRLFTLAARAGDQRLLLMAAPTMRKLSHLLGERVHLSVLHGGDVLTIQSESSRRLIEAVGWIGRTSPVHCTSSGRALLIDHSEDDVRRLLAEADFPCPGPGAPKDVEELLVRLRETRRLGYAVVDGEFDADLVAVAAPVRDFRQRIVAALNVSGPSFRLRGRLPLACQQVMAAAAELSRAVSAPPDG